MRDLVTRGGALARAPRAAPSGPRPACGPWLGTRPAARSPAGTRCPARLLPAFRALSGSSPCFAGAPGAPGAVCPCPSIPLRSPPVAVPPRPSSSPRGILLPTRCETAAKGPRGRAAPSVAEEARAVSGRPIVALPVKGSILTPRKPGDQRLAVHPDRAAEAYHAGQRAVRGHRVCASAVDPQESGDLRYGQEAAFCLHVILLSHRGTRRE